MEKDYLNDFQNVIRIRKNAKRGESNFKMGFYEVVTIPVVKLIYRLDLNTDNIELENFLLVKFFFNIGCQCE